MIINLTQHTSTPDQRKAGVVDLPAEKRAQLQAFLTFEKLPTSRSLADRASDILDLIQVNVSGGVPFAMIGGAPFFMPILAETLKENGIQPLYAFSQRIVEEQEDGSGGVRKVAVFKHIGFVQG